MAHHDASTIAHDTLFAFENYVQKLKLGLAKVGVEASRQAHGAYIKQTMPALENDPFIGDLR